MEALLGKSLDELTTIALSVGLPKYVGKQLADWLYVKRVNSFDGMTNISATNRQVLQQRFVIGRSLPIREAISQDGTRKYLFPLHHSTLTTHHDNFVETVYLPEQDRATLCVSTQAGCKMGCRFCMTGTLGFHGQLSPTDILNQIFYFDLVRNEAPNNKIPTTGQLSPLTNIVFMGEGEPMDNLPSVMKVLSILTEPWGCAWSPKRITVSSVGLIGPLKTFLEESDCHLAISLHNPFSAERARIMPAEKMCPINDVVALLKQYDWSHQRRVSFEYICFGGQNDSIVYANELLRLLRGLDCRLNLIRFHAGVESSFPASNEHQMETLRDYLTSKGLTTTIRKSRGEDILAACGMLVNSLNNGL